MTQDKQDCKRWIPWRSTQTSPRLSKYHTVSRYASKCNFIYARKKVRTSLRPFLRNSQMPNSIMFRYHIPNFAQNRKINVESGDRNSFTTLRKGPALFNDASKFLRNVMSNSVSDECVNEAVVTHFHMHGLRKTRKTSRHDSRLSGRELNLGPPEYEVGVYVCPFYNAPEQGMS
jgi:hypothetical protein